MSNIVKLFVVGAVLGSTTITEARELSLLALLRGGPSLHQVQAEQLPALQPEPALHPTPDAHYGGPGVIVEPAPHGHAYPLPAGPALGGHHGGLHGGHGYPVHTRAPRVKIEDPENVHPCAVQTVVMVPDPCAPCCDDCCESCHLVPVTICVPPCRCREHKVRKGGRYQRLDFGEYRVEIRVKDSYVEVDYDD